LIGLSNAQSSIVKQFPETTHFSIKIAVASLVFILMMFLSAGKVDEIHLASPIQEDAVSIDTQIPGEDEIDYDEFMNRLPLRKPEPKPEWLDWFSENRRQMVFS
jgi:hypothetical protein